nr:MAG TPA: hypothetical protein [Caudoviricetes sp.]
MGSAGSGAILAPLSWKGHGYGLYEHINPNA